MKILVCLSGASLINLGLELLKFLNNTNYQIFAVISQSAKDVFVAENIKHYNNNIVDLDKFIKNNLKNIIFFENNNLSAPVASGSFGIDKTIIAPCSLNTLAKIYNGICDNLITRSAAVAIKQQKKIIISPREMPFGSISLKQMYKLSKMGVCIAPPIIGEYGIKKISVINGKYNKDEDIAKFIIGKWLDLLEIDNKLYDKWS